MALTPNLNLSESPNIMGLFSRALLPKKSGKSKQWPKLSVQLNGVKSDQKRMRAFARLCNDQQTGIMPGTWPHILAFPLHLSLLTHSDFPLPLLGLVHLKNTIRQYRRLSAYEVLDIECTLGAANESVRGIEFDIITEVRSAGMIVWSSRSTLLHRKSTASKDRKMPRRRAIDQLSQHENWTLPEDLGRRYARLSGDFNPIHLHKLSASLFGFPRAIIHGMWSKSRALARLQQVHALDAFEIEVQFKLPVFLPGKVQLQWQADSEQSNGVQFQLLDQNLLKPHLTGTFQPL